MPKWTTSKIPPQAGRVAVVTGANGGLGYETALALGQAGADVILAVRNEGKATVALEKIRTLAPAAKVQFRLLDLSSLKSVRGFADRVSGEHGQLDVLVNNAAVMALSRHQLTVDGFEMQFGTNYLGHFALTGLLFPLLRRTAGARVISLSSLAHRQGIIDLADLQAVKSYRPWKAYSQSKLAMLIFAIELQRRSQAAGWGIRSVAAHPGWATTDLMANGPNRNGSGKFLALLAGLFSPFFSHAPAAGALPTLFAATDPEAKGGGYYGPNGFYELKGEPGPSQVSLPALDQKTANDLWEISEQLTGVPFPPPAL